MDTATAVRMGLLYLLPIAWLASGLADYWCHRRLRIERNAGARESVIHWLMLLQLGAGVLVAALLEINAGTLLMLFVLVALHEVTMLWDLAYATSRRETPWYEQWVHSWQHAVPWFGLAALVVLHPQAIASLLVHDASARSWVLAWKSPFLPPGYLAGLAGSAILFVLLPFFDELRRCLRRGSGR